MSIVHPIPLPSSVRAESNVGVHKIKLSVGLPLLSMNDELGRGRDSPLLDAVTAWLLANSKTQFRFGLVLLASELQSAPKVQQHRCTWQLLEPRRGSIVG